MSSSCLRSSHVFGYAARLAFLLPALFSLLLISAQQARAQELRFAVTDIVGLEELHVEYGAFQKVLRDATGMDLKFFPVANRTAAVEALKAQRIDVVLTGPAEYVIFRSRTNAYPIVGFSRLGRQTAGAQKFHGESGHHAHSIRPVTGRHRAQASV